MNECSQQVLSVGLSKINELFGDRPSTHVIDDQSFLGAIEVV